MSSEGKSQQWRIQDFPEDGALTPKGGGANLLVVLISAARNVLRGEIVNSWAIYKWV